MLEVISGIIYSGICQVRMAGFMIRKKITVRGIVQGVGFRPAMAKQAHLLGLRGSVANTRDSVEIEIQGDEQAVLSFVDGFYTFIPPNAVIAEFSHMDIPPVHGEKDFTIIESKDSGPTRFSIPPDIAMCPECRAEFNNPSDRRHGYPFITCGNCGPRYTYMYNMPYDRANTSMNVFPMCPQCLAEYNDPASRRYHIEGFSCPVCGPRMSGFDETVSALKEGGIAAIKGLGGYHIACSAVDEKAVSLLRRRKRRPAKPFAVMFSSVGHARGFVELDEYDEACLNSKVSPILVVKKRENCAIANSVAPGNAYLGIMIAYTPLHQLVFDSVNIPLVMTSANISGDPLIIDDMKAKSGLGGIVDVFLTHNRQILKRADDSISWINSGVEINVRKGRGRMPFPVKLQVEGKNILAVGAELKSNVSVVSGGNLVTSNHIGDLGTPETFSHFVETVQEMMEYYDVQPEVVVADMHPDYESTVFALNFAEKHNIRFAGVQHHYAHFLSCLFESGLDTEAAGIIMDGTGFGGDGTIWGGEIFTGNLHSFERKGHIGHFPLPGGERSILEPWRILAGFLGESEFMETCSWAGEGAAAGVYHIKDNRNFSPLTSSAGRLFDAAGALLGFRSRVSYEAEAAIYLEMLAAGSNTGDFIPVPGSFVKGMIITDPAFIMRELFGLRKRKDLPYLARLFHNTVVESMASAAERVCSASGMENVLLSGGVFQNRLILQGLEKRLASAGLNVFFNKTIPANDAGISVGQAVFGVYNA